MRTLVALLFCMLSATASAAADLNGDGAVDRADLEVMRAAFYKHDARADLNHDGIVNFADLSTQPIPRIAPSLGESASWTSAGKAWNAKTAPANTASCWRRDMPWNCFAM